jgi:hypothetical protein
MCKKVFALGTILLCATLGFSRPSDPRITITAPRSGEILSICTNYTIRWTHSEYFTIHPQNCTIYCGEDAISPPVPVTQDYFVWTVLRKQDGSNLDPMAHLEITIESPDYDALDGPVISFSADERITITSPTSGESFLRGTTCTFRWTHSAYYNCIYNRCAICFEGVGISSCDIIPESEVTATQDRYVWTVGRKHDGTYMEPGEYRVSMECWDGDFDGPRITIVVLELKINHFRDRLRIEKIPDCPRCFRLDPRQFELTLKGLDFVLLEVVRGGTRLASFRRFAPGKTIPPPVKITLAKEDIKLIKQRKPGFTVLVKSAKGKILLKRAVQLETAGK